MKKTILIGALTLISTLAQANMDSCVSAVDKMGQSIRKGIKAQEENNNKLACEYVKLANQYVKLAKEVCPVDLYDSLDNSIQIGKQTEISVCGK